MKNIFKLFGITALAAVIVFSMVACDNGSGGSKEGPGGETGLIEMVKISGGTFTMGSDGTEGSQTDNNRLRELPPHAVTLSGFHIGKYTVTQAQYLAVIGTNPSVVQGDSLPVVNVSWYDAVEFCNSLSEMEELTPAYTIDKINADPNNTQSDGSPTDELKWTVTMVSGASGYRLPTEAEWEYACRAGTTTAYNTGNDTITQEEANYAGTGTMEVGSFAPNAWGLYDMHGNVFEWCWDYVTNNFSPNYYETAPDPDTNPQGLTSGNRRVERGGGWNTNVDRIRSAYREAGRPQYTSYDDLGFRVVRAE